MVFRLSNAALQERPLAGVTCKRLLGCTMGLDTNSIEFRAGRLDRARPFGGLMDDEGRELFR